MQDETQGVQREHPWRLLGAAAALGALTAAAIGAFILLFEDDPPQFFTGRPLEVAIAGCWPPGTQLEAPGALPFDPLDIEPFDPDVETRPLIGLFTEPRPREPDAVVTPGPRPQPFAPWDGKSTVLYDLVACTETNLGIGGDASFSPNGGQLVWIANLSLFGTAEPGMPEDIVWVLDLRSGERRSYGAGRSAFFQDDRTLSISFIFGSNENRLVDIDSGETVGEPQAYDPAAPFRVVFGAYEVVRTAPHPIEVTDIGTVAFTWRIRRLDRDGTPLEFEALFAYPYGDEAVIFVGPTVDGWNNVFLVAPDSGEATFVSSIDAGLLPWAFPFATRPHMAWADGICEPDRRRVLLYDLENNKLIELTNLPGSLVRPLGDERLGVGEYPSGESGIVDTQTLEYIVSLPGNIGALNGRWSADRRFAVIGSSFRDFSEATFCEGLREQLADSSN